MNPVLGRVLKFFLKRRPDLLLGRYGDPKSCLVHLEDSRRTLLELSQSLDDLTFLRQPDPETWSPGMVIEHIALSEIKVFTPTLRKLRLIKEGQPQTFELPTDIKLHWNARAETLPSLKPKATMLRPELMAFVDQARVGLLEEASRDLAGDTITAPHPLFGALTARRWLQLAAFHEQHHLRQLKRIIANVKEMR